MSVTHTQSLPMSFSEVFKLTENIKVSQLMEAGCKTLHSEIRKLMDSVWSKEELPQQWKKCVISVYRMSITADCSNYQGIVLLSTTYKSPNIFSRG